VCGETELKKTLKITFFWDSTPCCLVDRYCLFERICCPHLQGHHCSSMIEASRFLTFVFIYYVTWLRTRKGSNLHSSAWKAQISHKLLSVRVEEISVWVCVFKCKIERFYVLRLIGSWGGQRFLSCAGCIASRGRVTERESGRDVVQVVPYYLSC
jgi:hypothetical protein